MSWSFNSTNPKEVHSCGLNASHNSVPHQASRDDIIKEANSFGGVILDYQVYLIRGDITQAENIMLVTLKCVSGLPAVGSFSDSYSRINE